jgi:hypothetical protein
VDGWTSTLCIVSAFVLAKVLCPLWATYVGWHLPVSQHRWVLPLAVVPLSFGILLYFNDSDGRIEELFG